MTFDRRAWDGERPLAMPASGAHTIGDIALVTIGCRVFSKSRSNEEEGTFYGGVVIGVDVSIDEETGETVRSFVVLDPYKHPIRKFVVPDSDVDRSTMEPPNFGQLRQLIRRLGEEVGKRKGMLSSRDMEAVAWMHQLMHVSVAA